MVSEILVNTGVSNGLLPDGTEPLPEPKVTSEVLWQYLSAILHKILKISILDMTLKIPLIQE